MLAHVDNRITYSGNGNATEFAYQFKILDRTDIKVLLTDADGKEKLLTKDYYVDVEKNVVRYPGYAVGAEVPESERPPVLPTGWKLTIYREVPVTQETDLPDQYPFNQVEDIGDKLTMIAQQLTDVTSRSLKISVNKSADIDTTIPFDAGKSFRIADDGKSIVLTEDPARVLPLVQGVYAQAQAQAQSAYASAAEAQTYKTNAQTYMNNAKNYSENVNVFIPSVSSSGVLSWTNRAGLDNPASVNIKGAKGDKGDTGAQGIQGVKGDKGDKGDTGATGAPGAAASIRIGNVVTGAPGTNVVVTNSGTSSAAILNFQIPRGTPGADGGVTVDEVLNATSLNPVANKTVYAALQGKVTAEEIANTYAKKTDISGVVKSVNNVKPDSNGNVAITVSGGGSSVTVDTALSATSTNPVQNKVVKTAIDTVTASIPTKVSTLENDAGYLTQHQSLNGYAKTSVANTWTAEQSINNVNITYERYTASSVSDTSTSATPTASTAVYTATGNFTLYLNSIASNLANGQTTVFTAYINANADYALSISVTGVVKYIGNASDVAITSAGLLLNIMMLKDAIGNVTSIVQASKLS